MTEKLPSPCALCAGPRVFRRGVCKNCYRKLRATGIELPLADARGQTPFVQWLRGWPAAQRQKLQIAMLVLLLEEGG